MTDLDRLLHNYSTHTHCVTCFEYIIFLFQGKTSINISNPFCIHGYKLEN